MEKHVLQVKKDDGTMETLMGNRENGYFIRYESKNGTHDKPVTVREAERWGSKYGAIVCNL